MLLKSAEHLVLIRRFRQHEFGLSLIPLILERVTVEREESFVKTCAVGAHAEAVTDLVRLEVCLAHLADVPDIKIGRICKNHRRRDSFKRGELVRKILCGTVIFSRFRQAIPCQCFIQFCRGSLQAF